MAVLVGKKAPAFSASAVINGGEIVEGFSIEQYLGKKYVIFFFYPADFTFVCPTELLAFQDRLKEFEEKMLLWLPVRLIQNTLTGNGFRQN